MIDYGQHTADGKRFGCGYPSCPYKSVRKGDVKKHHGVHGETKPFPCRVEGVNCTKRFKDPSTRTRHEKTVHMKKVVHCPEPGCGVAFVNGTNLATHVAERHPNGGAAWNPQAEVMQHVAAQQQQQEEMANAGSNGGARSRSSSSSSGSSGSGSGGGGGGEGGGIGSRRGFELPDLAIDQLQPDLLHYIVNAPLTAELTPRFHAAASGLPVDLYEPGAADHLDEQPLSFFGLDM